MKLKIVVLLFITSVLLNLFLLGYMALNKFIPGTVLPVLIGVFCLYIFLCGVLLLKFKTNQKQLNFIFLLGICSLVIGASVFGLCTSYRIVSMLDKINTTPENRTSSSLESETPFFLYVTGHDNRDDIKNDTLSDVDIILAIQPKQKKMFMVSIPRDTYLAITGGGANQMDKLTHSGIYGPETTVQSVGKLFNVNIDYFVKVNFNSLIRLVDLMGGIDIDNDQEFWSEGKHFNQGVIHLNGDRALTFSRERHSFKDGDIQRGRNQQKVIKAIIRKAIQPSMILRANEYVDLMEKYVETNLPRDRISYLIESQIIDNRDWDVESCVLKGHGELGLPSYAMPNSRLYMYVPDKEHVNQISEKLNEYVSRRRDAF